MKLIGISGLARSGKDSFYEMASELLGSMNIVSKRYAFADSLKEECDQLLTNNVNISAFTSNDKEKRIIRPLLVTYGTEIRRKLNPNCWIEKIQSSVKKDISLNKVVFITDVRFPNEQEWVHQLKGDSVHVTREGIRPPNRDEEVNNPILFRGSSYNINWGNFNKQNIEKSKEAISRIMKSILKKSTTNK